MTDHVDVKDSAIVSSHSRKLWPLARHYGGNAILALLWGRLVLNGYHQWVRTGSLIMLGFVLYNTILVWVTITRRPSISTSTQIKDWIAAVLTVALSMLFRPGEWHHSFTQVAGTVLQGVGFLSMVVALTTLGRSFGIVAANRGIKRFGPYGMVRHPLYASELIFFTGFLATNLSPYNLVVWFGVVCGLVIRTWAEEAHLCRDPNYQAYMRTVRYRFFPGLI